jgi:hypothetical protein
MVRLGCGVTSSAPVWTAPKSPLKGASGDRARRHGYSLATVRGGHLARADSVSVRIGLRASEGFLRMSLYGVLAPSQRLVQHQGRGWRYANSPPIM